MSYVDKQKNAEYARQWYQKNKERLRSDEARAERSKISAALWRRNHPEKAMLTAAKSRAKRLQYEFNISLEDVIIPEVCPVLNIPLYFSEGLQTDHTPALDRIDNSKGYIKGNVQVISHKANRHKADLSLDDISRLFNYVQCALK